MLERILQRFGIAVCSGCFRRVFLVGSYAIKVPRLYAWSSFLRGLISNMSETAWIGRHPRSFFTVEEETWVRDPKTDPDRPNMVYHVCLTRRTPEVFELDQVRVIAGSRFGFWVVTERLLPFAEEEFDKLELPRLYGVDLKCDNFGHRGDGVPVLLDFA